MPSVWEDAALPRFAPLDKTVHTDVLIIGGGIAGLLCAHMLDRAGADYLLVEADRICSGITKNTTAKLTSQHGLIYGSILRRFGPERARLYWEANERALDAYRALCADIDCDFEERDNYIFSADPKKLEREMDALRAIGVPAQLCRHLPVPVHAAGAVKTEHQAQFHPLKFLSAIARDLRICEHSKVRELVGTTAITRSGEIHANRIVVATHFPMDNKHGSYFMKLYQHRSYVLALEGAMAVPGMYADASHSGLSFRSWGEYLLLGGSGGRTGKTSGWQPLEAFARKHWPDAAIRYRWAAQDCMSLDGIPYIGPYSARTPELYVSTGFCKWGMTSAMAGAMLLTDLLQGRENPWAPVFSPSRTMLRPQLACNALESALNLLTPTAKRCPHMGCALKWNRAEHSWDCPCHGSRFSENGNLIDNPATADLPHS